MVLLLSLNLKGFKNSRIFFVAVYARAAWTMFRPKPFHVCLDFKHLPAIKKPKPSNQFKVYAM